MTEIAGNSQYLDGARRRDANSHRDIAFDVKLFGLRRVLWLGFKDHLGSALGGCRGRANWLRHRRRSGLSEIDGAGNAAWSVHRASASGDTVRDARDSHRTI